MLRKINKIMRTVLLITGTVLVIFKLIDKKTEVKTESQTFQAEEFDDIW